MKVAAIIPKAPDVLREAVIVLAGALIASLIVRGLPPDVRRWFSWPASQD